MAILRGGKRIGGIDVRVGIPRDRSLENVESDPRFRQKPGTNPETIMGRFLASVNEAEGFARNARFYVEFGIPKGIAQIGQNIALGDFDDPLATELSSDFDELRGFTRQRDFLFEVNGKRRVQAFCNAITLPQKELETVSVIHNGPARNIVHNVKYATIDATFYSDKYLRERQFFELWQRAAFNNESFNLNYYDNYVSNMQIYQLGSFQLRNERDSKTYACQIIDAFPSVIGPINYNYETNSIVQFTVTFQFRYWLNYYLDKNGQIDLGKSELEDYTIKQQDGGLFGKLPPELRRAGKQVLDEIKRNLPTGRITNGRVFPPFI